MGPTWGPPGSCRPQIDPMLAPWTLLSGQCPWSHPWEYGPMDHVTPSSTDVTTPTKQSKTNRSTQLIGYMFYLLVPGNCGWLRPCEWLIAAQVIGCCARQCELVIIIQDLAKDVTLSRTHFFILIAHQLLWQKWMLLGLLVGNLHLRENLARDCFTPTTSTITNSVQNIFTCLRYCD